jgi:hypothetical protein
MRAWCTGEYDFATFQFLPNVSNAKQTFALQFEYAGLKTPQSHHLIFHVKVIVVLIYFF